jgi:hypothetical protein
MPDLAWENFRATMRRSPDSTAKGKYDSIARPAATMCPCMQMPQTRWPMGHCADHVASPVMSLSSSSLPSDFSWLRPAYRPSEKEIDTYAHLIANAEGYPQPASGSRLFDEAELQLWIWRNEMRKRSRERRRAADRDNTPAPKK